MSADDTRDRVIRLESDVEHLSDAVKKLTVAVEDLTTLLNQAKGAKWALVGMASLGGFLAGKIGYILPWFQK